MKGSIRIGTISFEVEVDSDNPEVKESCQRILDNARESIEAAMAEAVCAQVRRLLPGVTAECTGAWDEGEEGL